MPLSALLPLLLGAVAFALAIGAAPDVPWGANPAVWLSLASVAYSLPLLLLPRLLKWGWEASYFGMQMFCIASLMLFGLVPALCVVLYSTLPLEIRIAVVAIYVASHVWWCLRFVRFYAKAWNDPKQRERLFQEESDAVYYSQTGDRYLFEKKPKLAQVPPGIWFITFMLAAFATVPFVTEVRTITNLPYTHIFLAIGALPISMMGAGMAIRGLLVCFHYPRKIKHATGKTTFVDLTK